MLQTKTVDPPSEDKRWRIVAATMRRYGFAGNGLIEALHSVQSAFGYLDESAFKFVSASLKLPLSRVYGVATFYNYFTLKPQGEHTCVVCMGTACYIKGAPAILGEIERFAGVKSGETTADGKLSVMVARCIGACGLAPAVVFDGEVAGNLIPGQAAEQIARWTSGDS